MVGVKEIVETRLWDRLVLRDRLEGVRIALSDLPLRVDQGTSDLENLRVIVHLFVEVPKGAESCGRGIAWFALDGSGSSLGLVGWRYSYLEALEARREGHQKELNFSTSAVELWVKDTASGH